MTPVDPVPPRQPPGAVAGAAPARRSTYLRSGLVALGVLVVAGLVINFLLLAHRSPGVLDGPVVAQDIAQSVQINSGGHVTTPPTVACPTREPLRSGLVFDCTLDGGTGPVVVTVTEQGDQGRFSVRVGGHPLISSGGR